MPLPNTKRFMSNLVHSVDGGYTLTGSGALSQTLVTFPYSRWVSGITDINGDGIPDIITGGPGDDDTASNAGRIFVRFGTATGGTTTDITDTPGGIYILGVSAGDLAGTAVGSVTDLNGDGKAEMLVGAPMVDKGTASDAGAAFVLWGRGSGEIDLADPFAGDGGGYVIKGELAGDHAGAAMASITDLNGDGKADILVGALDNDAGGSNAGAAYVVWGKSSGSAVNLTSVATGTGGFRIVGEAAGDAAGAALGSIHDLNGDGKADILVGATGNDEGGTDAGAVYVVFGKSTGTQVNLSSIAAGTGGFKIIGNAGDAIGMAMSDIGDVNGDGKSDILVGSSNGDAAYIVFGKSTTTSVHLSDVANGIGGFMITGESAGDLANLSVTGGVDLNRDGVADFVIGTPHEGEGGFNAGAVYVVWGGATATVDLSAVAMGAGGAKIVGNLGSLTGAVVSIVNDMNGDGTSDLIIGSPGSGESVHVVYTPAGWLPDTNIYGTNGDDVMGAGYGGAHTIGAGDDLIFALGGNDTIASGLGNDSINGGMGADAMTGGAGNDTYYVDDSGDTTIELTGEGTDTVIASIDWTLSANIENLTLDGFGLTGTGNSLANTITGSDNADTLNGKSGADTMIGGLGDDTYYIDNTGDIAQEAAGGGTDTVIVNRNWTLGANLENLVLTGAAYAATGNALDNTLTGGSHDDTLDGGAGADRMIGGLGNDSYKVDNAGDTLVENAEEGTDTVTASVDYTLSANVENLKLTGTARSATGNALANSLTGTAGNDMLDGAGGADTMTGGAGDDTYRVDNAGDLVVETAGKGTDTINTTLDGYVLSDNVENLVLSGSATHGTGNASDNSLTGTAAADVLDGGLGTDTMTGGLGNDTYRVDNAGDVTVEAAGTGTGVDTVMASVAWTLGANIEKLALTDSAHSGTGNELDNTLTGGAGNDALNGLDGNDTIDGGAGADTMSGGAGNDTYYVDNAGDVIVEAVDGGTDTVVVSSDWTLSAGSTIENIRVSGGGHALTGNDGDNTLSGSSGHDTLDGGAGDDVELGGDGNDTLVSTSGHDSLSGGSGDDVYEIHGGAAHIEDFLGHDELDAHEATGDSHIDLSGETDTEIENEVCDLGQGGNTVGPLDVQFLQDLTGSFGDDIASVRLLVPGIVAALQAVQPDSEFGLSSFIDKAVSPFGAPGEWVYQLEQGLTANAADLAAVYNAITTHSGEDLPECQIESLMHLALTAADVGFRPDAARFVVVFTDAPFHVAGDGAAGGITTPNNGDAVLDGVFPGTGEDYPAIAQLAAALQAANIIPIFAVTADVTTYYTDLVAQLGRGTTVTLTADSSNVIAAVTGGLTEATRTVIEDATGGTGNDTLIGNDAINVLRGNDGRDHLDGRDGNDTLDGGLGNDTLDGGKGVDTLKGGAGNDLYYVDLGDVVTENANSGADTVLSSSTFTLALNVENLTLTGSGNRFATGNALDNHVIGNVGNNTLGGGAGNDVIDGGKGADIMRGGAGDDRFYVDNTGDKVTEYASQGTDTVCSSVSFVLGNNVENLILTGVHAIDADGNGLINTLVGNIGDNILNGGAGNDTLTGRLGADTFVFGLGSGADIITDFSSGQNDRIDVSAYTHGVAHTAFISQSGADTVIDLGGGNVITIQSTTATDASFLNHITW